MNKKLFTIFIGIGVLIIATITLVLLLSSGNKIKEEDYPIIGTTGGTKLLSQKITEEILRADSERANKFLQVSYGKQAFVDLIDRKIDIAFMYEPTNEMTDWSNEFEKIKIAKDALVFINNRLNLVSSVTQDEIKNIYSKSTTNWETLKGNNSEIIPYQRNYKSDAQQVMNYFMQDKSFPVPSISLRDDSLDGLIYAMEKYEDTREKAIGYCLFSETDKIDLENLNILSIDESFPMRENIKGETYPANVYLYAIIRKDEPENSVSRMLIDYLISEKGQKLIKDIGYVEL